VLAHLRDGALLELPDALARDVQLAADLLESAIVVIGKPETGADDVPLAGRESLKRTIGQARTDPCWLLFKSARHDPCHAARRSS
jgi:hypothetical protein